MRHRTGGFALLLDAMLLDAMRDRARQPAAEQTVEQPGRTKR